MASRNSAHGHGTKDVSLPRNLCYACGKDNPDGMHLKFKLNETRTGFVSRFRLARKFTGPPGHAHGGVIATILDEAMGKVNKLRHVVAVTSEMTVSYIKPVPLGRPLVVESWEHHVRGRFHTNVAEIRDATGQVLARSKGRFVAIDAQKMFGKHLRNYYINTARNGGQRTELRKRSS